MLCVCMAICTCTSTGNGDGRGGLEKRGFATNRTDLEMFTVVSFRINQVCLVATPFALLKMMLLLRSILRDKPTVTYAAVIRYNQADPAAQKKRIATEGISAYTPCTLTLSSEPSKKKSADKGTTKDARPDDGDITQQPPLAHSRFHSPTHSHSPPPPPSPLRHPCCFSSPSTSTPAARPAARQSCPSCPSSSAAS